MWLDERPDETRLLSEGWFPGALEDFFEHTMGEQMGNGRMRLTTQDPLEKPYSVYDWFHGSIPDETGKGVPVQTTIFPYEVSSS